MAIRLLPFRQYNDHNVVNLFAGDFSDGAALDTPFINGNNDNGVFVKVSEGDMTKAPVEYQDSKYLGKTNYPYIGRDQYPVVPLKFVPATTGSACLGVTLNQTLTHDENGEKMIYYPQKALELQSVMTGEAVPILSKGLVTLSEAAVDETVAHTASWMTPGQPIALSPFTEGKVTGMSRAQIDDHSHSKGNASYTRRPTLIGQCLATGSRVSQAGTDNRADYYGGQTDGGTVTGKYYVVQIDCANPNVAPQFGV